MRISLIQLITVPLFGQVIFSEVMYNLAGTDNLNKFVGPSNLAQSLVSLDG